MSILSAVVDTMQTLDMDGDDAAWRFGFEDSQSGVSEFNGYMYFAGHNLRVYFEAHAAGLEQRHMLQSGQVVEPEDEQSLWSDGYDAGRNGAEYDPTKCASFKEGYSAACITSRKLNEQPYVMFQQHSEFYADVQPSEQREDWIGA